ncbi:MAG: SurA N-terminal domain-containing protein [Acidobacteria bacterium]|nr:SurA N-terminal domain-containing protein [Acidobacteriota bacterium]
MYTRLHPDWKATGTAIMLLVLTCVPVAAQSKKAPGASAQHSAGRHPEALPPPRGESLDRIVAIVNGEIILESDVEEEMRWAKLQPYRTLRAGSERDQALSRLIDRTLIMQQEQGYVQAPLKEEEIDEEVKQMRDDLPACERYKCQTEEGWRRFLAENGFTEQNVRNRVKLRMQVLRFIQQRFRAGIRISDQQIDDFYKNTMLPQYAKEHATPPPLESVSARIEQVLLQQQVSSLLDQWLKTLRDQGQVRILKQGEEAP